MLSRLRQHGTSCCICISVFVLYERKTKIQKKIKHRSAEGLIADRESRINAGTKIR
jgi:hypothetical protein